MSAAAATMGTKPGARRPVIPNAVLGMVIFVFTEVMFFAALVAAYMVVSAGATNWPPPDQPRLPVGTTAVNSLFLLASGVTLFLSNRAFASTGGLARSRQMLGFTVGLGAVFVGVQGYEWARLLAHGLTMQSSPYGSFFYLIVGTHALHALIAIGLLFSNFLKRRQGALKPATFWAMQAFWYFVVGVWPILFVLVYLN